MPNFIYTVIVINALSWFGFFRFINLVEPDSIGSIATSLVVIYFALLLTISLPFYFYFHAKAPTFSNLRFLYRRSLKWSAFISFGIVFILGLRAFNIDNIVNIALFLIFYFLLYSQARGKR